MARNSIRRVGWAYPFTISPNAVFWSSCCSFVILHCLQGCPWYSFLPHFKGIAFFFLCQVKGPVSIQCDLPQGLVDPWKGGTACSPSDGNHYLVQPVWIILLVALEERWKWTLMYFLCHTSTFSFISYNSLMKWSNYCHLHLIN